MRKFLFCCCLAFLGSQAMAQKVKTNNVSLTYDLYPTNPLPVEYKKFAVFLSHEAGKVFTHPMSLSLAAIKREMKVVGFEKVEAKDGGYHFSVLVEQKDSRLLSANIEQAVVKENNVEKTVYFAKGFIETFFKVTVKDASNQKILWQKDFSSQTVEVRAEDSPTREHAAAVWKAKAEYLVSGQATNMLGHYTIETSRTLSAMFSVRPQKVKWAFAYFKADKKDKSGTLNFENAIDSLEKVFEKVEVRAPLEKLEKRISPYMEFWQKTLEAQSASDEKTKPTRFLCAHNLFIIYALLEKTEEARKFREIAEQTASDPARYKAGGYDYEQVGERLVNIETNRQFLKDMEAGKSRYQE